MSLRHFRPRREQRRHQSHSRTRRLSVEPLEDRRLLAIWVGPSGGTDWNWSTAANWDSNDVPDTAAETAVFGDSGTVGTVVVDGNFSVDSITFNNSSGSYVLSGGTLTLTGATPMMTVSNSGISAAIGSTVAGTAGLTKAGVGTLTLSGNLNHTGGTAIDDGMLTLKKTDVSFPGPGTTGQFGSAHTVTVNSGATLQVNANWVMGDGLANQVAVNGGTLQFLNSDNYLGNIVLTGGAITTSGGDRPWRTGNWGSGLIQVNASATPSTISGSLAFVGTAAAPRTTFRVADGAATDDLIVSATIYDHPGFAGAMRLVKEDAGTMRVANSSSFSGGTTISQGSVTITSSSALGSGTVVMGDANTGTSDVMLVAAHSSGDVVVSVPITVTNQGSGAATIGGIHSGGRAFFNGLVTLNRDVILLGSGNDRTQFRGGITGTGNVTVTGGNRTTWSTTTVTYEYGDGTAPYDFVGGIFITGAGTRLQLNSNFASGGQSLGSHNVDVGAGARLMLPYNVDVTINALTGNGNIEAFAPGSGPFPNVLVIGANNGSGNFSGTLSQSGGATLSLVKAGTGTQTLTGNNSYSGATRFQSGVLSVPSLSRGNTAGPWGAALGNAANLVFDGGTLQYTGATSYTGLNAINRPFTVMAGGGAIEIANPAATVEFDSSSGANSPVGSSGLLTLTGAGNGIMTQLLGSSFTGGVLKSGSGTWTLNPSVIHNGYLPASPGSVTVLTGTAVADVDGVAGGIMNGGSIGANTNAEVFNYANDGTTATFALAFYDGTWTKSVKIQLSNSGGNVVATVLGARYWAGNVLSGFNYDTTPGANTNSIAASDAAAGYGCKALTLLVGTSSNAYSGGTMISRGTLRATHSGSMSTGTVTLGDENSGANDVAWLIAAGARLSNPVEVADQGTGAATLGSYRSGVYAELSGGMTFDRAVILTDATGERTTFSGRISGNVGTVTIAGNRVTFADGTNDFAGDLTINSGSIYRNDTAGAIPDTTNVLANGIFQLNGVDETIGALNGSGVVTNVSGANTLTVGGADNSGTFTGLIADEAGLLTLRKTGTGIQTLTPIGDSVLYNASYIPVSPSTVTVLPGIGVSNVRGVAEGIINGAYISPANAAATAYNFSNHGTMATFALAIYQGGYTKAVKIQLTNSGGGVVATALGAKYWSGNVLSDGFHYDTTPGANSQSVATSDSSAGYGCKSLTLALASYSGGLTVSQGTVLVGNAYGPGTGTITLNDINTGAQDTTFLATVPITLNNPVAVAAAGTGVATLGTADFTSGANMQFSGAVTLGRDATLQAGNSNRTTFAGQITGEGNVTIASPFADNRRIVFERTSGAANDFAGDLYLGNHADLQPGVANSIGNRTIPDSSNIYFAPGSRLRFAPGGADDETVGALISQSPGAGTVDVVTGGSAFTLTVGTGDDDGTFSGRVQNTSGSLRLVKTGAGKQALTDPANSFRGGVTIGAGTLSVPHLAGGNTPSALGAALGTTPYLVFDGGVLEYTGSTVAGINRAFTLNAGGGTLRITHPSATVTWTDASGAGPAIGIGKLTKDGAGTLELGGAGNSYSGGTDVNAGTLLVNTSGSGTGTGPVAVNSGSILGGSGKITGNVASSGTGAVNPGASPGILTVEGNYSAKTTFEINSPYLTAGIHYDQIVVNGAASAIDLSSASVTFASVGGGIVPLLPNLITLIQNNTTSAIAPFSNLPQGAAVMLGLDSNSRTFIASYAGGDGNDLVLFDAGTPATIYIDDDFSGGLGQSIADADQGTTGLQAAIFGVNAFASLAAAQAAHADFTGNFVVNDGSYGAATLAGTQSLTVTGPDAAQTAVFSALTTAAGQTVTILGSSVLTVGDAASTPIAGTIAGGGSLVKTGTGTLTLSGTNAYTGGTTIRQGTLLIQANSAVGSGTVTLNDGNTGTANTAFLLDASVSGWDFGQPIVVADHGSGTSTIGSGGAGANPVVFNSNAILTLNRPTTLTAASTDSTIYQGPISGSVGTLTVSGGRRTSLEATNTFAGDMAVVGTNTKLQIGTGGATSDVLPDTVDVSVASGADFDLFTQAETINNLTGSGRVQRSFPGNTPSTLTVGGGNEDAEFSGVLREVTLRKVGTGTHTLSGAADNPSAKAIVAAGTLVLAKASTTLVHALGSSETTLTVNTGATVRLAGSGGDQLYYRSDVVVESGGVLDLNGRSEGFDALSGAGTINNGGAQAAVLTVGEDNTLATYSGALQDGTGTLALVKVGNGVQTLSSAVAHGFTGGTTVSGGTLRLAGGPTRLPAAGEILVNGGGLDLGGNVQTVSGTVSLQGGSINNGTLDKSGSAYDLQSGLVLANLAGSAGVSKTTAGTVVLGGANTYLGATEIVAGTLRLPGLVAGAALWLDGGDSSTVTHTGGAVSQWADKSGNDRHATAGGAASPTYTTNALLGGKPVVRFNGTANVMNVDLGFLGGSQYTILAVEGRTDSGVQRYFLGTTGNTQNNALQVGYRNNNTYTLAQYSNDLDATVAGYSSQQFRFWSNQLSGAGHAIYQDGAPIAGNTNTTPLSSPAGQGMVGGANFVNNPKYYRGDLAEIIVFASALNAADRQAAEAYLQAKWLAGTSLPAGTAVSIASGATLDLGAFGAAIGSLNDHGPGGGTVTTTAVDGPVMLTLSAVFGNATFSGTIRNGDTSAVSVSKAGGATQTLSAANTYTGTTTVGAGTLLVNGSITSDVTVTSPGVLGGNGTVAGSVSGTGMVAPGVGPGTLTVAGNYSASTAFEVNAPYLTAGLAGDYDQVIVNGAASTIDLSGATFAIVSAGGGTVPALPAELVLIQNNTGNLITPFSNLAEGGTVTLGSGTEARDFQASYLGGDGNDLILFQPATNVDEIAPTVTINQATDQPDPALCPPVRFTVVFSEPVTGFGPGGVILSGTAAPATAVVTGSGTTYEVAVSGMSGSGSVIVSIAAGAAQDAAGNLSEESASTDNEVWYLPQAVAEFLRFDFNAGGSPTQGTAGTGAAAGEPGYIGVEAGDTWNSSQGYGWMASPFGFNRAPLASPAYSDLLRDGAWASVPRDFRMHLLAGQNYDVTVTFGDASFARDRMNVTVVTGRVVSGLANVTNVATAAGRQVHRSFVAAPDAQGELVLRFSDSGGDPYWTVNAIEVRPTVKVLTVTRSGISGPQQADGATVDTFLVTGYTPNAWYTVSTDMGQVTTADADPRYAGVQVQAPDAGSFQFTVHRGTGAGTASVRVEEVNGASRGSTTQAYVFAALRRFDFNGSGVDTQLDPPNDFWNVRGSDVYTAAMGHGWNAAVGEFQRGTDGISEPQLDSLYRDGHWHSATRTFQVAVDSNKTYEVRIHTGDRSFARDQLRITVEGVVVEPLVATAANEFQTIQVLNVTPSGEGVLDIQIANLGGDPYWVINGIEVAESGSLPTLPVPPPPSPSMAMRFDFNSGSPYTASGFTGVGTTNVFNSTLGYGWTANASTFSRGIENDLLRDGHWGTNNTFSVNVPGSASAPKTYCVNVTLGDASFARNNISVSAEGGSQLSGLATAAGQFIHRSFLVTVSDGQLNVRIASTGGDPYFTINALEVFAAPQGVLTVTGSFGAVDGTTPDTINVSGTTSGELYTVTADLGTIQGVDASTAYAGFQVLATTDFFTFAVQRPTGVGSGTPQIRVERVTGQSAGTLAQTYTLPGTRRFDFDGSVNDTQTGFLGVRGNQLYSAAAGYGWTVAVPEFQRTTTSKDSDALYRDGHWGSAARTFQVQVDPALNYDVRVYIGDASFARNNIEVSVDGGANWELATATAANDFTTVLIDDIDPATDTLEIVIRNGGGDPFWVINGIEIWDRTISDPSEFPLLAASRSDGTAGNWLTEAAVAAVLPAARDYWISTGLTDVQIAELYRTPIAIGDLSYRGALGVTKPEGIWLDASGAGLGWHTSLPAPHSQLPTSFSYDLLTVLAHELGHVLGYDDLDGQGCAQKGTVPFSSADHIMVGVLQPGTGRVEIAAGGGLDWLAGGELSLLTPKRADGGSPAAGGRGPLDGRGVLIDRVIDDLLRDDLRVSKDAWNRDEGDELERLLRKPNGDRHEEIDHFFARLE